MEESIVSSSSSGGGGVRDMVMTGDEWRKTATTYNSRSVSVTLFPTRSADDVDNWRRRRHRLIMSRPAAAVSSDARKLRSSCDDASQVVVVVAVVVASPTKHHQLSDQPTCRVTRGGFCHATSWRRSSFAWLPSTFLTSLTAEDLYDQPPKPENTDISNMPRLVIIIIIIIIIITRITETARNRGTPTLNRIQTTFA